MNTSDLNDLDTSAFAYCPSQLQSVYSSNCSACHGPVGMFIREHIDPQRFTIGTDPIVGNPRYFDAVSQGQLQPSCNVPAPTNVAVSCFLSFKASITNVSVTVLSKYSPSDVPSS